jgi:hypothetical protein
MSNPPPPPRRSRAAATRPPASDELPVRPKTGDVRHEAPEEPVYNLDDVGGETDEAVKQAIVREVVEHAERVKRDVELARPMESYRARPMVLALLAVVSLSLAVYSYVARPAWVFGPTPDHVPMAQREGHLRYAIFLAAERVLEYRELNSGSLPRTLREVGESWPGMSYHVDGETFELRARVDSTTPLVYRSTQDPRTFLGTSRRFLREREP